MKITGFGTITSTKGVEKKRDKERVGVFADTLSAIESAAAGQAGASSEVATAAPLGNLLALQEISEDDMHRRKMLQRGVQILDTLDALRRQLLGGGVTVQTLERIEQQLNLYKGQSSDPKLAALIEDIELRAAVELAKLQMARAENS